MSTAKNPTAFSGLARAKKAGEPGVFGGISQLRVDDAQRSDNRADFAAVVEGTTEQSTARVTLGSA